MPSSHWLKIALAVFGLVLFVAVVCSCMKGGDAYGMRKGIAEGRGVVGDLSSAAREAGSAVADLARAVGDTASDVIEGVEDAASDVAGAVTGDE